MSIALLNFTADELQKIGEAVRKVQASEGKIDEADVREALDILARELTPASQRDRHLSEEHRQQIIEALVADWIGHSESGGHFGDLFKRGFVGFANMTDDDLLQAYTDAFDRDFFEDEADDADEDEEIDTEDHP